MPLKGHSMADYKKMYGKDYKKKMKAMKGKKYGKGKKKK